MKSSCPECDLPIKVEATSCPHCGRPSRFPNINFVTTEEQEALEQRYQHSLQTSPSPEELKTYQNKVTEAECVIARSFDELKRLLASDNLIYETFYMRVKAGRQKYQHQSWDRLRAITDNIIFGETLKENIRFGSLTLDGNGLPHYGECYWILHTDLISHRTSLFEENTVTFCQTHNTQGSNDFNLPKGYRAKWEEAGKLAVAKLEGNTEAIKNHATCLQSPGSNKGADDKFIECHIWGDFTIRTIKSVKVHHWKSETKPSETQLEIVKEKLKGYNVTFSDPASCKPSSTL